MSEVRQYEITINYDTMPWLAGLFLNPKPLPLDPFSFSPTRAERKIFRRRKHMLVSEWAEKYRVLQGSKVSNPGPWKNEKTQYLVGIMDSIIHPFVETVILCKGPQIGGTESTHNFIGYCIDRQPGPMLLVYPTEKDIVAMMPGRIKPMIENTSKLRDCMTGAQDDLSNNLIKLKNMSIYAAWSNSASSLASKSIRYVIFDETDKYPETAGKKETDPVSLGEARTITFGETKKIIKISTPTTESNYIWQALTKEAQVVFDYWVRCPLCGRDQKMVFAQIKWAHKTEPGEDGKCHSEDPSRIKAENLAWYECLYCSAKWDDYMRNQAVRLGAWRSRVPENSNRIPLSLKTYLDTEKPKYIGFHLPSWISPFVSFGKIAHDFLRGMSDMVSLKKFYNEHMAEPWRLTVISKKTEQILAARCDLPPQTVPEAAIALTCGVDVQMHGFWFTVRAWSAELTSWLVHYGFLATWEEVETLIFKSVYPVGNTGRRLRIFRAAIDTGGSKKYEDMTMTEETYFWLIKNRGRGGVTLCGTKGSSKAMPDMLSLGSGIVSTPSGKKLPEALRILMVDTSKFKDQYHFRLNLAAKDDSRYLPGAAFLHSGTGTDYAAQILAEEKRVDEKGREWVNIHQRPNHLLDAEILAAVCADIKFPGGGIRLLAAYRGSGDQGAGSEKNASGAADRRHEPGTGAERPGWMANR